MGAMIEAYIERWSGFQGTKAFGWSIWREGKRIQQGATAHADSAGAESAARAFCEKILGQPPDHVTEL